MVQKEVGERLNAKPDSKDYNSLTIFINYYFDVNKLFDVSRNVFVPKPNVDSSIMQLNKKKIKLPLSNEKLFFKLIRDSFKYKRKTLKNNLIGYDLDKIEAVLKNYNLDLTVRAEHLSINQFADISNHL
jgi:16S rRNA (adenine1518-N6/adenine1519-N6)-dimethyltransferase